MKQGWEIKKLGDVCETGAGGTPLKAHKDYYEGGTIPWLLSGEVSQGEIFEARNFITEKGLKNSSAKIFPENTVLVAMYGATAGQVGILKFSASTNQAVCGILPNDKTIPEYLFYCFLSKKEELISQAVGGAQPNISQIKIRNTKIPLPPLTEQQRIVSILDEAFDSIAKAKANAEQNLRNAKELFESYLEGVFERKGQGWEEKVLGEIAKVIGGYSFKSSDFLKKGKYQVIRMGNVRPGIIRENESPVFIDKLDENALKRAILLPKDVIITQTGTKKKRDYGFTVIIEEENYLLNQRISAIRFAKDYLPKFFLYFSWTNHFKDQFFANETGTVGQGNVGIGAITGAIVPFIPVTEQQTIVQKLDALSVETKKLEAIYQQKINDLEEMKKSILQKAFRGGLNYDSFD
jgi:type I restriction enzyme S subunit